MIHRPFKLFKMVLQFEHTVGWTRDAMSASDFKPELVIDAGQ